MAAIVLAGAAGLFGAGPFSRAKVSALDLIVEHERFGRYQAPQELRITFGPSAIKDHIARIWFSRSYMDAIEITSTLPQPIKVEVGIDRVTFLIATTDAQGGSITFSYQPQKFGRHHVTVGIEGGLSVQFSEMVYP